MVRISGVSSYPGLEDVENTQFCRIKGCGAWCGAPPIKHFRTKKVTN